MRTSPVWLLCLCVWAAILGSLQAQVVISEIHYRPVEEPAFNTDGSPVLDLTDNVHEFVEIQNTGSATLDLSGWQLGGGISYDFPAGATIAAGGFRVIAKNPVRLATVYGLAAANVLGPYTGKLGNSGDSIRVRDSAGNTVESVNYSATFPWPVSADAFGAGGDFTGLDPYTFQYRGRSLQRVSVTASSNDPANWVASSLPAGPTPGSANPGARAIPKPVVVTIGVLQQSDEALTVRANQPVRINATFSSNASLSNVQLEWFVDAIESYGETRTLIPMTDLGNGQFTTQTSLPGQVDRSIVRYRIKADRGAGTEVVSPRPDDPQIVPVSSTNKEGWHAYFVQPARTSARPVYDFFISAANTNILNNNISQSPRRVLDPDPPGYPRDEPFPGYYPRFSQYDPSRYPAANAPHWNGKVPAIFVFNGEVYDVQARFHGSRYRRSADLNAWKITFPASHLLAGLKQRILITEKGGENVLGYALFREGGLPAAEALFVDFYRNNDGVLLRCEIGDNDEETLKRYQQEQIDRNPENPPNYTGLGAIYKAKGLGATDGSGGGPDEGPYGVANGQLMPSRSVWSVLDRYIWSYPIQNSDWVGHKPFKDMLEALWKARGDASLSVYPNVYAGQDFNSGVAVNLDTSTGGPLRTYLEANWDVDQMLTYLAIRNWCSPWDDKFHNYHVYHEGNGKWMMTPWDFDAEMSGGSGGDHGWDNSIFAGRKNDSLGSYANNGRGPEWLKDTLLRAYEAEYKQRLFILNNTLLHPSNIATLTASLGISSYDSAWVNSRFSNVNTQVGLGTWYQPRKPTNSGPANASSVVPPTSLQTSAYSHTNPALRAHQKTRWEIRTSTGNYKAPLYVSTSITNLTSLPIPFEKLKFGTTYFWRATYFDVDGHPSPASTETSFTFGPIPQKVTLINTDAASAWKYNRLDTNQTDAAFVNAGHGPTDANWWASPAYDDGGANWGSGAGMLGYDPSFGANPAAFPVPFRTFFTSDGQQSGASQLNSRTTFYFRKRFNVPGSPEGGTFRMRYLVDDGCVVHVNGVEVSRTGITSNIPVEYGTTATIGEGNVYVPSSGFLEIPAARFQQGDNVIAVEVHQSAADSNDVALALYLEATLPFLSGDILINEVLADNRSAAMNGGRHPDYLELYNRTFSALDISGWKLTDDVLVPGKFVFPNGTSVPAQGFLVVWCDRNTAAPGLHSGFGISAAGQQVALFQGNTLKDYVTFGPQAPDLSLGRAEGAGAWTAVVPSPGSANVSVPLGSVAGLKVNEWMANPSSGEDYFEIYNADVKPVALGGLYLSDTASALTTTQVPGNSFIGAKGFALFLADGISTGANHANFKLSAGGENLYLTNTNGSSIINSVAFGAQATDVSQGRLPDGGSAIVSFPQTASPAASNYLSSPVVINEALSASSGVFEDAIELWNPGANSVNISGWWLSDDAGTPKKYQIPSGTSLPAGGYFVVYEQQFNSAPAAAGSFALSSLGDEIVLSAADDQGNLTGYRSQVHFGAAADGVSFGRVGNVGVPEFWPTIAHTFGQDVPSDVAEFRTGQGAANAQSRVGPVIFNEVMYHPVDGANGADNSRDEFIELHNATTSAVDLSGWVLQGDAEFVLPAGTSLAPNNYLLLVSFDPTVSATADAFRAAYGLPANAPLFGPYSSKLSNASALLEIAYPGPMVEGVVPMIMVDRVHYLDVSPWPVAADGTGKSLQRVSRTAIGNDPANWSAAVPSPTASNGGQPPVTDSDGDGMSDAWENAHGFDPFNAADAGKDADGDGQTNLEESLADTDPRNPASFFRADVTKIPGGFRVSFTAAPGKSYTVQGRSDWLGSWTNLFAIPAETAQRLIERDDLTTLPQRFYRIVTPGQP